jgi:hypothetical protein
MLTLPSASQRPLNTVLKKDLDEKSEIIVHRDMSEFCLCG